jgi:hypothetical protein
MKLPEHLAPLFWSYNFQSCDTETIPKTVIFQVLQYGTLRDWQWLSGVYGKEKIRKVVLDAPETSLRKKVRPLVQTVFFSE